MAAIQLDFNFIDDNHDIRMLQKQLDAISDSVTRTRKRLFAEIGELRKAYAKIALENAELKNKLNAICGEAIIWDYICDDQLFKLRENND